MCTQVRSVRAGAGKWEHRATAFPLVPGAHFGNLIENHYSNHYSGLPTKHGKLKRVIDMRMWRNWQTRRI